MAVLQETGGCCLDCACHLGLGQRPRQERVRRWRGLGWAEVLEMGECRSNPEKEL